MATQNNNMADYTTIDNPYDNFVDRSIENIAPIEYPLPVGEGAPVGDFKTTGVVSSANWKPQEIGFQIDAQTGIGQFIGVVTKSIKLVATGSSPETQAASRASLVVFKDSTLPVFQVNSWWNPAVGIYPNAANGMGSALIISYPQTTAGLSEGAPAVLIENQLSNCGTIGINMLLDAGSAAHLNVGIKMAVTASSGTPLAFWFNGNEYLAASSAGSQNRMIRIKIGNTLYYIPAYTGYV